jgi:hypothetical protein
MNHPFVPVASPNTTPPAPRTYEPLPTPLSFTLKPPVRQDIRPTKVEPLSTPQRSSISLAWAAKAVTTLIAGIGHAVTKAFTGLLNWTRQHFTKTEDFKLTQDAITRQHSVTKVGPDTYQVKSGTDWVVSHQGKYFYEGSAFKADKEGNLTLIQGSTREDSYGPITRTDGRPLWVNYVSEGGRIKPTGIDFTRMAPWTELTLNAPLPVAGLGTIHPGTLTYQGPKGPNATPYFSSPGTPMDLEAPISHRLGITGPAMLQEAGITLRNRVMALTSATLSHDTQTHYISDDHAPINVTQLTQKATTLTQDTPSLTKRIGKVTQDMEHRTRAAGAILNNLARQTGVESPKITFDSQPLKRKSHTLVQTTRAMNDAIQQQDWATASDSADSLTEQRDTLTTRTETLELHSAGIQKFQRSLAGIMAQYKAMGPGVDVDTLRRRPHPGYEAHYAEEKGTIIRHTQQALHALVDMADEDAMAPAQARQIAQTLVEARDGLLNARPYSNTDQAIQATKEAIAYPLTSSQRDLSRSADAVIFNRLNALAETHPTMGQIIGTRGETGSRWALWGVKAYFTGTLAISAVVSPVGTAIALGAGGTTTYALRKADVNDEAAGFYGLVVGIVTGGKVAKSKVVGRWDAAVRGELSGWITGGLKLGKQVMEALGGPRLMNERGGGVVVEGAVSEVSTAGQRLCINPQGQQFKGLVFKIDRTLTATEANQPHVETGAYPPYKVNSSVQDVLLERPTRLVRVHREHNQTGRWFARWEDVEGLSPTQIKYRFGLKYEPTYISDVYIPEGRKLRVGICEAQPQWGTRGDGVQFELLGREDLPSSAFRNKRLFK